METQKLKLVFLMCILHCSCFDYDMPATNFSHRYYGRTESHIGLSGSTPERAGKGLISIPLKAKLSQVYDYQYADLLKKGDPQEPQDIINYECEPIFGISDSGKTTLYSYQDSTSAFIGMAAAVNGLIYAINTNWRISIIKPKERPIILQANSVESIPSECIKEDPNLIITAQSSLFLLCNNWIIEVSLNIVTQKWDISDSKDIADELSFAQSEDKLLTVIYSAQKIYLLERPFLLRQIKVSALEQPSYSWVHISKNSQNQTLLMVLEASTGLLVYDLLKEKLEYSQNFYKNKEQLLQLSYLEQVYHGWSTGILQLVMIDKARTRQLIVQAFYERKDPSLHINKVYHNYAINSAANRDNSRHQIKTMILGGKTTMNIGLVVTKHKTIIFQYGINRRIGNPQIVGNSQFLREDVYTGIIDAQRYPKMGNQLNNKEENKDESGLEFFLLMDRYIFVIALDGSRMATVNYNCRLPAYSMTNQLFGLKNVSVLLKGTCPASMRSSQIEFCEELHEISFILHEDDNLGHSSDRMERKRHMVFIMLEIATLTVVSILIIFCWKQLLRKKDNLENQQRLKREKTSFGVSTLEIPISQKNRKNQK